VRAFGLDLVSGFDDVGHWIGQNLPLPYEINDAFSSALSWVQRSDSLVLDLDGGGIETLAPVCL
jgi:hypothetical protein